MSQPSEHPDLSDYIGILDRLTRRQAVRAKHGTQALLHWSATRVPWNRTPRLDRPIFIWGAPRSGTTLLYKLIGQHPAVAYPTDATGDPREGTGYWWDVFGELRGLAPAALADPVKVRRMRAAYADLVREQGKARLLEKTPFMVLWVPLVNVVFPDALHIHIIRDGRAVVNSILYKLRYSKKDKDQQFVEERVLYGPCPPELVDPVSLPQAERHAQQWRLLVEHGRQAQTLLGERYLEVRYEDLTAHPRETMSTVMSHVQLPVDEEFLVAHYAHRLENRNSKWRSADAASVQDGFTARRVLTSEDLPALQAIAADLRALGYDDQLPSNLVDGAPDESPDGPR